MLNDKHSKKEGGEEHDRNNRYVIGYSGVDLLNL